MMSIVDGAVKASVAKCCACLSLPGMIAWIAVALSAILFLETPDMIVGIIGSTAYLCFSALKRERRGVAKSKMITYEDDEMSTPKPAYKPFKDKSSKEGKQREFPKTSSQAPLRMNATNPASKPALRYEASKVPLKAASFCSVSWDAQLQELLRQIEPTPESRKVVHGVERMAEEAISTILPCARVVGYASANPLAMKAFGVVVPEVDIVVNLPLSVLKHELVQGRMQRMSPLKVGLRTCTNALIQGCGFKFRRSAFQADVPKVVLNVPTSVGLAEEPFGINIYVNTSKPSQWSALFEECTQLEPRARDLILLVRRWARDRAVSHSYQKGTLTPYVWTLLTIYFLQVGKRDEGPLLPAITTRDGVLGKRKRFDPQPRDVSTSVAALFKEFFDFYNAEFDWSREMVSIGDGVRGHARACDSFLLVLDPFDMEAGPTECLSEVGFARLREELTRAQMLCSSLGEGTLAELLVPWAPPEVEPATYAECEVAE